MSESYHQENLPDVVGKICTGCGEEKSLDAFRRARGYKDGIHSDCKACEAERLRRWRETNPEKWKAQWDRQGAKHRAERTGAYSDEPEYRELRKAQQRNNHLQRNYGITLDDLLRMHQEQDGRCKACGKEIFLTHVKNGPTINRAVVDHCHTTLRVRALLCDRCNRIVGHVEESPDMLRRIADYLDNAQAADR